MRMQEDIRVICPCGADLTDNEPEQNLFHMANKCRKCKCGHFGWAHTEKGCSFAHCDCYRQES